jgi:hypothetical protein
MMKYDVAADSSVGAISGVVLGSDGDGGDGGSNSDYSSTQRLNFRVLQLRRERQVADIYCLMGDYFVQKIVDQKIKLVNNKMRRPGESRIASISQLIRQREISTKLRQNHQSHFTIS